MSTIYPVVAMLSVNKQSTFHILGHDVRLGLITLLALIDLLRIMNVSGFSESLVVI